MLEKSELQTSAIADIEDAEFRVIAPQPPAPGAAA
jgi:hypothetical protein